MRSQLLIARTIFIEALRRREIYVIVVLTLGLLAGISALRFFDMPGLHKFQFEVSLKVMSVATALTVIVLGARQLPREFENRTIYTLIAKPIARWQFLLGKYLGVVAAGGFCLALFMAVFLIGSAVSGNLPAPAVFLQYVLLQLQLVAIMAALAFLLSLLVDLDAAITICALIYLLGQVLTNSMVLIYDFMAPAGQFLLRVLNYIVPQPAILDLSGKVVHDWPPVSLTILGLTFAYTLMFVVPYLGASMLLFRRRAL